MGLEFNLMLGGMLLLFVIYAVYNYQRGVAAIGIMRVHRDKNPVWFRIYLAINIVVLVGTVRVFAYYLAMQQ